MKKILLIITIQPLTAHNFIRLGVGTKYNSWKIIYWNVLPLINPKVHKNFTKKGSRYLTNKNYIEINSIIDLQKEFKHLPKSFFYLNLAGVRFISSVIDRFLNLKGGKKIEFHNGNEIDLKVFSKKNIKNFFYIRSYKIILKRAFFMFLNKVIDFFVKKINEIEPILHFVFNNNIYEKIKKKINKKKIIKTDGAELHLFLQSKKRKQVNKNYILLIDDMVENSFDYSLGRGLTKDKEKDKNSYWHSMKDFLDFLKNNSKKYKIIVAASPRRNLNNIPIVGYKFFFDKTADLIRDAKIVICHNSLACQIAVLFKKPIVFLTSYYYKTFLYYSHLNTIKLSKTLGTNLIYIDKEFKPNNFLKKKILESKPNLKKYAFYQKKYIQFSDLKIHGRWRTVLKNLDNQMKKRKIINSISK